MPCFTDTSLLLKTTFWPLDGFRLFVSLGSCLNQVYPTSPFIQTYCKANKMKWCKFHRILFYFKFIHFFNLKVLFFWQWSIRIRITVLQLKCCCRQFWFDGCKFLIYCLHYASLLPSKTAFATFNWQYSLYTDAG